MEKRETWSFPNRYSVTFCHISYYSCHKIYRKLELEILSIISNTNFLSNILSTKMLSMRNKSFSSILELFYSLSMMCSWKEEYYLIIKHTFDSGWNNYNWSTLFFRLPWLIERRILFPNDTDINKNFSSLSLSLSFFFLSTPWHADVPGPRSQSFNLPANAPNLSSSSDEKRYFSSFQSLHLSYGPNFLPPFQTSHYYSSFSFIISLFLLMTHMSIYALVNLTLKKKKKIASLTPFSFQLLVSFSVLFYSQSS